MARSEGHESGLEQCPKCGARGTMVYDSRPTGVGRIRRRKCLKCPHRFTTYEINARTYRTYLKTLRLLEHVIAANHLPPGEMKKILYPQKSS